MRQWCVFWVLLWAVLPAAAQQMSERLPVRVQGRWGCIDRAGKMVIAPEYEFIEYFRAGKAIAQKGGRMGVIDAEGRVLLPFEHLNLDTLTKDCFAMRNEDGFWGVIRLNGEVVVPIRFEEVDALDEGTNTPFFLARKGKFWGLFDAKGREISPADYEKYEILTADIILREKNGLWGAIDNGGREILPAEYENICRFPYKIGVFLIQKQGKLGVMNADGTLLAPCEYTYIKEWNKKPVTRRIMNPPPPLLEVGKEGKIGVVTVDFVPIIPPDYAYIRPNAASSRFYTVGKAGKMGIFDTLARKEVLECAYEQVFLESATSVTVRQTKNNLLCTGIYDLQREKLIIPVEYPYLRTLVGGKRAYYLGIKEGKTSIFDGAGKPLIVGEAFDDVKFDGAGIFFARRGDKWGLFNEFGYLPPAYDGISPFKRNLALVQNAGSVGLANIRAQIVVPIAYKNARMTGQTARMFAPDGSTDVFTLNEQGEVLDKTRYQTRIRSISATRKKETDKKGEDWEFDLQRNTVSDATLSRAIRNGSSNATADLLRATDAPTRSYDDVSRDGILFRYHREAGKWFALRSSGDTLFKPAFEYINERPQEHMIEVMQVRKETSGVDAGKHFPYWGIYHTQQLKWTFRPARQAMLRTAELLRDFTRGAVGRTPFFFVRQNGTVVNSVKVTERGKSLTKPIFYAEPYDTLTNLAEFNVGGYITDKRSLLSKSLVIGGKWGLMNRDGVMVLPATHDKVERAANLFWIAQGQRWGVADSTGKVIVPCQYSAVAYVRNTQNRSMREFILLAQNKEHFGFLDSTRFIAIDAQFKNALPFREGFAPVMQDSLINKQRQDLWTYIDRQGRLLRPFTFKEARHFSEQKAAVRVGHKWGYIDAQGNITIEPAYSLAYDFHEGKAAVRDAKTGKFFYIDASGALVGKLQFASAGNFSQGVAIAQDAETRLFGLLNAQGEWLLPPRYAEILPFDAQGYARYKTEAGAEMGLLHRQGKILTKARYTKIEPFDAGLARVAMGNEWNFIDTTGAPLLRQNCKVLEHFDGNFCLAKNEDGWGYINRQGDWQIKPIYERASHFEQGVAEVKMGNSPTTFIDTLGRQVEKPTQWLSMGDMVEHPADSLAPYPRISYNGRWGYWDRAKRKVFIYPSYRKATPFCNNFARVEDFRGDTRYISLKKNTYKNLPNGVSWLDIERDNFKTVRLNGLYGFATLHDFVYSAPKFSQIGELVEGRALAAVPTLYGVADRQGKVLLAPIYERVLYVGEGIFRVEINDQIGYWHQQRGWLWTAQK